MSFFITFPAVDVEAVDMDAEELDDDITGKDGLPWSFELVVREV